MMNTFERAVKEIREAREHDERLSEENRKRQDNN